jgi:hypothetical protein
MPQSLLLSDLQSEFLALQECQTLLDYLRQHPLGPLHKLVLQTQLRLTWLQLRYPHQNEDQLLAQLRLIQVHLGEFSQNHG